MTAGAIGTLPVEHKCEHTWRSLRRSVGACVGAMLSPLPPKEPSDLYDPMMQATHCLDSRA